MRGSNESTPPDRSDAGSDAQFVDLPLFPDLEPDGEGADSGGPEQLEAEPEATGPIRPGAEEHESEIASPIIRKPRAREALADRPQPEELPEPAILPAVELEPEALELDLDGPEVPDEQEAGRELFEGPASLTNRLGAALLDLTVMASAAIALLGGAALLGSGLAPGDWPAFVLPWLAFSFLYHVVPLAFWGRTPGMASMGIMACHLDGGSLSFVQAIYRWLASLGTTVLLGLPGLLALTGRSAADRASESVTIWRSHR